MTDDILDEGMLYPLYEPEEQRWRFEAGHLTYKLPRDMNRHEYRRVAKFQRNQKERGND